MFLINSSDEFLFMATEQSIFSQIPDDFLVFTLLELIQCLFMELQKYISEGNV
jgi:hypothetical protein